jgi:hypothetical protein
VRSIDPKRALARTIDCTTMRDIVNNLKRQHLELTRITMALVPLFEPAPLSRDASEARRLLQALTGVLKVHISMEDRSFYPSLLQHRDAELRALARDFLARRDQLQTTYFAFINRWTEAGQIERDAGAFIAEAREMLFTLGQRMVQEDTEFHPLIVQRWDTM